MPTKLNKAVTRDAGDIGLRGGDAGEMIITLYPGGTLGLRRKRGRRELCISLAECYRQAASAEARRVRREDK